MHQLGYNNPDRHHKAHQEHEDAAGAKEVHRLTAKLGEEPQAHEATLHTACPLGQEEAEALYKSYYKDAPFTFLFPGAVDLKQVVNTNKCLISLEKHGGELVITSVIDNLLKGAAGQAVQNMNLMLGLEESTGLKLKASAF